MCAFVFFYPLSLKISALNFQEHPPEILLEFRPLADYCNAILMCFNDIRLCAPIALAAKATRLLQESLGTAARSMLAFYRQVVQTLEEDVCIINTVPCILSYHFFVPFRSSKP